MKIQSLWLLGVVVLAGCGGEHTTTPIADLTEGQIGAVKGRTGERERPYGRDNELDTKIFTLRDDWGGFAHVHVLTKNYPWMGVTYYVRGRVHKSDGSVILEAASNDIQPATGPNWWPLIGGIALVVAVGAGIVATKNRPPSTWGHLVKVNGVEPLTEFALKTREIEIGRGADVNTGIRFFQDDISVSRIQGVIRKQGKKVFFENRSPNGTVVSGQAVDANQSVELTPGAVIEMGSQNAIVLYRPLGMKIEGLPKDETRYGIPGDDIKRDTTKRDVTPGSS
jgi:hypothetical protein